MNKEIPFSPPGMDGYIREGARRNAAILRNMQVQPAQSYVVGFMFDGAMEAVALIRKNKPAWQAGLLNGIGGKVESEEPPVIAMVREFKEEAGVQTFVGTWKNFCSMSGENNDGGYFSIEFFFTTIPQLGQLISMESEKIEIHPVKNITAGNEKTIGNLPWLVALALDFGKGVHPPSKVSATYSAKSK